MTQPEKKSISESRQTARDAARKAIELAPRSASVWVTPFCGPEADMVMVNIYDGGGPSHYWSPAEALAIAGSIARAAHETANPPAPEVASGEVPF